MRTRKRAPKYYEASVDERMERLYLVTVCSRGVRGGGAPPIARICDHTLGCYEYHKDQKRPNGSNDDI